jgi:hypothetical protein
VPTGHRRTLTAFLELSHIGYVELSIAPLATRSHYEISLIVYLLLIIAALSCSGLRGCSVLAGILDNESRIQLAQHPMDRGDRLEDLESRTEYA